VGNFFAGLSVAPGYFQRPRQGGSGVTTAGLGSQAPGGGLTSFGAGATLA